MTDRATDSRGGKATDSASGSRPFDLRRAVALWISDGKSQGWSPSTVTDRQYTMQRLVWWLENEEECPATLDALTPDRIRRFLIYAREPRARSRYGRDDHPNARREARPATVHAYYREIRALTNFCIAEG